MTGIRRGSSFAEPPKPNQLQKGVHFEENGSDDRSRRTGVSRKHHSLLISHFVSTVVHLISSILLYLSWHFADSQCGETSIFLTNLQAILIIIYAVTVIVKVGLLIKHFCHIPVPAKYINIITIIIAAKQFLIAVICEVFLEASTMVPRSGCPAIRNTLPVWSARLFYLFSIVINSIFFALSNKFHARMEETES
ncbi:hypothetical protein V3C99_012769 [Haemonchus contortus]